MAWEKRQKLQNHLPQLAQLVSDWRGSHDESEPAQYIWMKWSYKAAHDVLAKAVTTRERILGPRMSTR